MERNKIKLFNIKLPFKIQVHFKESDNIQKPKLV